MMDSSPVSFSIKFVARENDVSLTRPRGTIEIDGESVILSRKGRMLGSGTPETFSVAEIRNVRRDGKVIRFQASHVKIEPAVDERTGAPAEPRVKETRNVGFAASSETEAQQIERLLPTTQTPEFHQTATERQEFQQRLLAMTPRTFVTPALVAINVVVFVAMALGGAGIVEPNL